MADDVSSAPAQTSLSSAGPVHRIASSLGSISPPNALSPATSTFRRGAPVATSFGDISIPEIGQKPRNVNQALKRAANMGPTSLAGRLALNQLEKRGAAPSSEPTVQHGHWDRPSEYTSRNKNLSTGAIPSVPTTWNSGGATGREQNTWSGRQATRNGRSVSSRRIDAKLTSKKQQNAHRAQGLLRRPKVVEKEEEDGVVEDVRDNIMEAENVEEQLPLRVEMGGHKQGVAHTIGIRGTARKSQTVAKHSGQNDPLNVLPMPDSPSSSLSVARMHLARNRDMSSAQKQRALAVVGQTVGSQSGTVQMKIA
ncbi:hypothetical protein PUNSTDRAFT_129583 [Punctularia strigosozonata HHB-11173 SS5]|uniref:uncharacterized protein n=1 Tax=Punctularia strigosozonata (strain HHB-11173) TaxID=741275 RepID=UPI000441726D|nr:uncharacterized protein PUNSTDRAFT_129583 [Punctularia strigosozonata HHB-11173 SS5]EIN13918.1 hypothetical protein PUNSTDRAFT_129583 [Punctularia strigosozonata HHB-11173 SS5]